GCFGAVAGGGFGLVLCCAGEAEAGVDDSAFAGAGGVELAEGGGEVGAGVVPVVEVEAGGSGLGGGHGVVEPERPGRFGGGGGAGECAAGVAEGGAGGGVVAGA